MSIILYFCMHTREAFNSTFDELFALTDVFVIESTFTSDATPKFERAYNRLSKGELTPGYVRERVKWDGVDPSSRSFYDALPDILDKKNKAIYLEHSPLTMKDHDRWKDAGNFDAHGSLESILTNFRSLLQVIARDQRRRNESLASQLHKTAQIRERSRIMLIIGAGHKRGLEKNLELKKIQFQSKSMTTPMILQVRSEVLNRFEFDEPVSDAQLAMSLLEQLEGMKIEKSKGCMKYADIVNTRTSIETMNTSQVKDKLKDMLSQMPD